MNLSEKSYKILCVKSGRWNTNIYKYEGRVPIEWEFCSRINIQDYVIEFGVSCDNKKEEKVIETNANIRWIKTNIRERCQYTNNIEDEFINKKYDKLICINEF